MEGAKDQESEIVTRVPHHNPLLEIQVVRSISGCGKSQFNKNNMVYVPCITEDKQEDLHEGLHSNMLVVLQ